MADTDKTGSYELAKVLAAKLDGLQAHVDLKFDQVMKEIADHREEREKIQDRIRCLELTVESMKTKIAIFSTLAGLGGAGAATAASQIFGG